MDLSYIDPQSKGTKLLLKMIKAIIIIAFCSIEVIEGILDQILLLQHRKL